MIVTVLPDENWLAMMPTDRPPDTDFYRRLCVAASDPTLTDAKENTHRALYRLAEHGVRSRAAYERQDLSEVTEEACLKAFRRACLEAIETKIRKEVGPKLKKGKAADLTASRHKVRERLLGITRPPPGVVEASLATIRTQYDLGPSFSHQQFSRMFAADTRHVDRWHDVVQSEYDQVWARTVSAVEATVDRSTDRAAKGEVDDNPKEEIFTCPVSLKKVLRQEFQAQEQDLIFTLIKETQKSVTDTIAELAVLAHKALILMAAGHFYDGELQLPSSAPRTFDTRAVLPQGYTIPEGFDPVLQIAPIPQRLQDHLLENPGKDMDNIQSHYFLQALYTAFLGVQQRTRRATEDVDFDPATAIMAKSHPLWTRIVRHINSTSDTADLAAPLEGLSSTMNEAITELATSMKNIWEGNISHKLLDYLLRFLLRIFLAPEREKRNKERIRSAIKKREEKKEKAKDKKPSKSLQQLHARELCDELADHLHSQPTKEHRITAILTQLARHEDWDEVAVEGQASDPGTVQPHDNADTTLAGAATITVMFKALEDESEEDEDEEENASAVSPAPRTVRSPLTGCTHVVMDKEPPRSRLRALQSVLRMLLESPHLSKPIDANWVKKTSFKGSNFTLQEREVVAFLANTLRPYVPKRRRVPGCRKKTEKPLSHMVLQAPMVILANNILVATGYQDFTRKPMPHVSAGALHGLALGAVGFYEVLCASGPGHFDCQDADGQPLTNYKAVTKNAGNKEAVLGAFLDLPKIHRICDSYGMSFRNRIVFVNDLDVHLVGVRIKHGELRASGSPRMGHPVSSRYEDEKKKKRRTSSQTHWDQELAASGLSRSEICNRIQEVGATVREEENVVKTMREDVKQKRILQSTASEALRKADDSKKDDAYAELRFARIQLRMARTPLTPHELALSQARQELYYLNRLEKASKPPDELTDGEDSDESENNGRQSSQDESDSEKDPDDADERADDGVEDTEEDTDKGTDEDMDEDMDEDSDKETDTDTDEDTDEGASDEDRDEDVDVDQDTHGADESTDSSDDDEKDGDEDDSASDESMDEEQEATLAGDQTSSPEHPQKPTIPTLDRPTAEDRPECIDLNQLAGEDAILAFGGTDYGLAIMSRTIAQTKEEIEQRIARYGQTITTDCSIRTRAAKVQEVKLPPPFTITARQIDSMSHLHRNSKTRQKRLQKNASVRDALSSISTTEASLTRARTTTDLDRSNNGRRAVRSTLQAFKATRTRNKELRTQSIRTQRAYATICADERRYVQEHSKKGETGHVLQEDGWCPSCTKHHVPPNTRAQFFRHIRRCPRESPRVVPVLCIGDAGTSVGCRFKGHAKRGGTKLRQEHRRYTTVAVTGEYRTSKTCVACYQPVELARARRLVNGEARIVAVHGALECVNPSCEHFQLGYTIKARDPHSALCILLNGASDLLPPFRPLPPFRRTSRTTQHEHTNNASAALDPVPSLTSKPIPQGHPAAPGV
ncbi:hypothetical protein BGZ70_000114 [Mortierella alpina]|uniref:Uncharacterized protein n=1 Tax=Mortierella alpina TaxID=64518 RepID=A0A9P6IYI0_MORAP|nr:hypothetical protein BGZ70_000114 [Mortierella alpina]